MTLFLGKDGVNREIKEAYLSVGGVNKEIKEIYAVQGGVNRKVYSRELFKLDNFTFSNFSWQMFSLPTEITPTSIELTLKPHNATGNYQVWLENTDGSFRIMCHIIYDVDDGDPEVVWPYKENILRIHPVENSYTEDNSYNGNTSYVRFRILFQGVRCLLNIDDRPAVEYVHSTIPKITRYRVVSNGLPATITNFIIK